MKYAVVVNGRNQVIVKEGEAVLVDDLNLEKGKPYTWENVLVIKDGDDIKVGTPYIKGSKVEGKVDAPAKGPKVINFKKKRRKGYARKVGHRQKFTRIIVEEIK